MMPYYEMIVPVIMQRIVDRLQRKLVDEVSDTDPCKIDQVKIGRYQQNPSQAELRLAVIHGDVDGMDYIDGITPRITRTHPLAFEVEAREMGDGGTEMWYRRGIVYLELFFISQALAEEDAREYAYSILGRVQNEIQQIDLSDGPTDAFGEQAKLMLSTAAVMIQAGGPPSSWIFRGKVFWDCLTARVSNIGI